ncbi:ABC transporter substrate-binding protein [Lysinibacillus irui]|uniref:ABC transporter substrate-binding protein n=1 Tax=Lysinibacillus irui TaxID=2998077 RepID=A0AAJ5RMN1_9BACI|nr:MULTISPECIES: ABC transporter substrate-binding protein [Lysinibacillus]MEA0554500.1 ABC transporter substrate-binding protein [Lysinibacillus irui]MEA0564662.1 ABC transporter substrate-binding protein [Lysinibacillus irui]MEA0976342.1 ABC transporter substrate-binding protein [Lysinibacillus irui]MEA1042496.1 ABC transporter substrate-binding protein [Lysinibacillus irui]WDV07845.1 ABC transporter substrate-binding protein [Lysinibacillus irui]
MKKWLIASTFVISLTLVGCVEQEDKNIDIEVKKEETQQQETANTAKVQKAKIQDGVDEEAFQKALASFPTTIPENIVTTSVPLTEMLHLLGITPVGVPTSTNPIPTDFDSITKIGSPMSPDLEVISSLQSDLIIGASSLQSSLDQALQGMNLPTAYLPTDSYEDLKLSFKVLGTYFAKEEKMNDVLQRIVAKEKELEAQAQGKELPSVMLVIGTSDSFMVMNDKSYLGSLVERLGADNIAKSVLKADSTYSPMNLEDIIVADPDIVFVLASGDHGANEDKFKQEIEKNSAWQQLSAYKNNKIYVLDYSTFGVTSITNVETALTTIADYFYK